MIAVGRSGSQEAADRALWSSWCVGEEDSKAAYRSLWQGLKYRPSPIGLN